mmetsp:Transcript_23596/g.74365  ORF Transcript_23596/g.74365 Transcript_23596/m.74365 type:complete len:215 (+) Transcript_23596:980-1624(+)
MLGAGAGGRPGRERSPDQDGSRRDGTLARGGPPELAAPPPLRGCAGHRQPLCGAHALRSRPLAPEGHGSLGGRRRRGPRRRRGREADAPRVLLPLREGRRTWLPSRRPAGGAPALLGPRLAAHPGQGAGPRPAASGRARAGGAGGPPGHEHGRAGGGAGAGGRRWDGDELQRPFAARLPGSRPAAPVRHGSGDPGHAPPGGVRECHADTVVRLP